MERYRVGSRAIVIDPVEDRVQRIRYEKHKASLDSISRQYSKHQFISKEAVHSKEKQQKIRRSKSYVKQLFDNTAAQNENLVKKMMEIDDRKNNYKQNIPVFPYITNSHKKQQQQQIKRKNQILVERILEERQAKSKRRIMEQSCVYEKYKENLRKIKGENSKKLVIAR